MARVLKIVLFAVCVAVVSIVGYRQVERKMRKGHCLKCYSQEGEDMLLRRYIGKKREGFFVDVGAYHPVNLSNTYHFYERGWRGINIDAMPGSMNLFRKLRPEDTNLELAIGIDAKEVNFFIFEEPAFNTCNPEQAQGCRKIEKVAMLPLRVVLKNYVPEGTVIDFFSIDVEGLDLEVLKSNDWEHYSPNFILVESLQTNSFEEALNTQAASFLKEKGYLLVAKTKNTLCFQHQEFSR